MYPYHPYNQTLTTTQNDSSDSCSEDDLKQNTPTGNNPTRKRRRGIIEKRRRDRINTSLSELKKLVPQALEKSGSAKLEKAEILQMTVDYLKTLNASYDQSRVARDYHGMGFRECATEASRYLVSIEGMDIQDPLRIRLMSHLQMFIAQRTCPQAPPPAPSNPPNQYNGHWGGYNPPSYGSYENSNSGSGSANYTMTMTASVPNPAIGFTAHVQANPLVYHPPPTSDSVSTSSVSTPHYTNLTSSKPYRPWGAEMASC